MENSDRRQGRQPDGHGIDRRLVILAPEDNVCVACTNFPAGLVLLLDGVPVTLAQPIGLGHKIARRTITPGEKIIKYGAAIGSATAPIQAGDHVHLHNMKSDYIPTYALEDEPGYVGGRGI
jgi:altronate dehydratase small subunit